MVVQGSNGLVRPTKAAWVWLMIAIVICLMVVLRILAVFVGVIFIALVAAGLLYRPFRQLKDALHGRRRTAAALICVLLVLALMVPLAITGYEVSQEARSFYDITTELVAESSLLETIAQRQDVLDRINPFLAPFGAELTPEGVLERLASAGTEIGGFFYKQGVSLATGMVRFVIGFLVWVIVLYYMFVDGPALRTWFRDTIPLPANQQDRIRDRFMGMASSLVVGNGAAAIFQGLAGGLVFAALDLPGPVLWGVTMGILAFIPVVGISFVYLPAWALLMLAGDSARAFSLLIPLAVLATIVEYWLKPLLVGRRAHLHTLLVFFSLLGGFDAFGPIGLLLGPLMMTMFLTLVAIYRDSYRPFHEPSRMSHAPQENRTQENGTQMNADPTDPA